MSATDDQGDDLVPELEVTTARRDDCVVLTLAGELDIATGPVLDDALNTVMQDLPAPTRLVLDLSALAFTDVAGLGVVLRHERGLTLKALGRSAGLSHPFLSQLERGLARPSVSSVERIASRTGDSPRSPSPTCRCTIPALLLMRPPTCASAAIRRSSSCVGWLER